MQDDDEQLSQIIGDIYDAALDPDQWEDVLDRVRAFLSCMTAALTSFDLLHRRGSFAKFSGYDPHYLRLYMERYMALNPLLITACTAPVGAAMLISEMMPIEELRKSVIWREWSSPQGMIDGIQVNLEKSATAVASFTAARHERVGPVDPETRHRVMLLWPHFQRAVLIGKVIDLHKVEAAALADALDGLAAAMLLVNADGRIVHANARAHLMLERGDALRTLDGKLVARDAAADRTLRNVFSSAEAGDEAIGVHGIAVPLSAPSDRKFIAHVLPLTAGTRRQARVTYSAVAAVFVREAEIELPHPVEALAEVYRLTPAELRVLMAVTNIGGVPEIAPVLGISEETVRTHLKRIYEKTDTSRQADLVKLVAGYVSPLAPAPRAGEAPKS